VSFNTTVGQRQKCFSDQNASAKKQVASTFIYWEYPLQNLFHILCMCS